MCFSVLCGPWGPTRFRRVVEEAGSVSAAEMRRVLASRGIAYLQADGKWKKVVMPLPRQIDQWTHWLYGPGGNAVANEVCGGNTDLRHRVAR